IIALAKRYVKKICVTQWHFGKPQSALSSPRARGEPLDSLKKHIEKENYRVRFVGLQLRLHSIFSIYKTVI
ncbi:MAG: hypothetical protein II388_04850, partial [Clostridia bacterium]|nr:hypothetical protein [Clostridia bacterium]